MREGMISPAAVAGGLAGEGERLPRSPASAVERKVEALERIRQATSGKWTLANEAEIGRFESGELAVSCPIKLEKCICVKSCDDYRRSAVCRPAQNGIMVKLLPSINNAR